MDDTKVTVLVLLDFFNGFNTVSHEIVLLSILLPQTHCDKEVNSVDVLMTPLQVGATSVLTSLKAEFYLSYYSLYLLNL